MPKTGALSRSFRSRSSSPRPLITRPPTRLLAAVLAIALLPLCACITVSFGPSLERSIEREQWLEAGAGPFRVVSNLPREQALELANRLILFDRVAREVTNVPDLAPRVPTLVLALGGGAYGKLDPPRNTAGLFVPTARGNFVLLDGARRPQLMPEGILFHEYGHFVLRNSSDFQYPAWYDEGIAEMLRTTRVEADAVVFGDPLVDRLITLSQRGFMSSERMFTVRSPTIELSGASSEIFYAQAWLTSLYLGYANVLAKRIGLPDRKDQLLRYLALYNEGVDSRVAFAQAFEITFEQLDKELQMFLRKGSTGTRRIPLDSLGPLAKAELRVLRPAEAAAALGSFALVNRSAHRRAERLFERAVALAPDDAAATLGLARSRMLQNEEAGLRELYERGRELAASDPIAQLNYAEYLVWRASRGGLGEEERAELARGAVALLEEVAVREPNFPETYYQLGLAHYMTGERAAALTALRKGYKLLPSDLRTAYLFAKLLGEDQKFGDARRVAARGLAGTHDLGSAAEFENLLASWPAPSSEPADSAASPAPANP
jgi:tetratricopeptide (TPR) repeat protein